MFKIINNAEGKFIIKEVDAEGNSIKTLEEMFATEGEAQAFIDNMSKEPAMPENSGVEADGVPAKPDSETAPASEPADPAA